MDKVLWRKNWLKSINELTDYNLQKKSWLNTETKSPHWSYIEFMCSYFNDLNLENGYQEYLTINWVTEKEYLALKDWHYQLVKYKSPKENEWANDLIIIDKKWLEVVKLGEIAKENLYIQLTENEKEILKKNLISEIQ